MNLLDKAISVVSPRAALRRVRHRVALELTAGYLERHAQRFRYEGASAGRRSNGWYAASTDANVELMGSLIWLRNRSRDLVRNNPYAARAIEELAGNVVGTGIVPKAKTGNVAIDKVIDAEWPFFAETCDTPQRLDFYGMQTLTVRTMAESGEAIARFRPQPADFGLRIPLQLQMLEADFLDQARTMGLVNGHVMEGVQFDEKGRRVAYWLFSYHPGGVLILNPRGGIVSQPVPADQIMHVYRVLRPGQVRGVPWLAPVMMSLRDLEDYCDAERVRKKIESCVTAFVTQPEGIDGDPLGLTDTDPISGLPVENFQPGMVEYLKPGQDVKFNNPPAAGGYREYKMTELQGIMAGIGLPYELGTGDMSQVNYSSWRGGMLGFRNTVEAYRWLTLIPLFCMPVWRRFIDTLILQGKIPAAVATDDRVGLRTVQWTAPRFESVDPVKDAEAVLKDVRMGRKTWFEAVLENGYDPTTQIEQIALFNKLVDKFQIILDSDPRNTTLRGQAQPAANADPALNRKFAPAKGKNQQSAALSEEDLGMIRELLAAGMSRVNSSFESTSRLYRG
ncbi:MAG TPA: phage portal protein [Gemmataceae bacterium]|nr:phage portal protein [Bryobacteraceae bacterium]HZV03762.1 phage portal protein [Gemmataceae bacterium]